MSTPVENPTEASEARILMQYMKLKGYRFTHIKNETGRSVRGRNGQNWRAIWDKRDGVSKGFPDFAIIAKNQLIIIELKRKRGSTTSPEQKAWIADFQACGIPAAICKGADEAIAFIEATLKAAVA